MLAHCRQLSAEKCCACAGDDLVADMAATGGGTGRRAWLGRLPGVRVTGSHAQLMLPGRFLLHRLLPLSRSAIHPCWGARACHVLLKLAACCHQVLHCVLHDLTVTWSGMPWSKHGCRTWRHLHAGLELPASRRSSQHG